jgi:hypothetical protein
MTTARALWYDPAMKARLPRWLLIVLALAVFGQGSMAAAHCLRLAAAPQHAPFHVEICTTEGIVVMDLGGTADHEQPSGHDHAGFCLACHGLPQVLLPDPAAVPLPAERAVAARFVMPEATPPLGARAPPYAPRGPPSLS